MADKAAVVHALKEYTAAFDAAHEQLHRHDGDPDYIPSNADTERWYALHQEAERKAQIFYALRAEWQKPP